MHSEHLIPRSGSFVSTADPLRGRNTLPRDHHRSRFRNLLPDLPLRSALKPCYSAWIINISSGLRTTVAAEVALCIALVLKW